MRTVGLGYLEQARKQDRVGHRWIKHRRRLRLRQLRFHPTLLGDLTPALGALPQVHDCVIVGVATELIVDEHADQVTEVGHDVASPGIRRPVRTGLLIRGRRLRSGARCSSAARNWVRPR